MDVLFGFATWMLIMAFWITLIGGGGYLLLRFVRAHERRSVASAEVGELRERVHLLEEAQARMEAEFARLDDAQRFTTQLLAERPAHEDRALPEHPA